MLFRPACAEDAERIASMLNSTRHYPYLSAADFRESLTKDYSHLDRQMWIAQTGPGRGAHLQYFRHPYSGYMAFLACDPLDDEELIAAGLAFLFAALPDTPVALVVSDKVPSLAQQLERRGFGKISEDVCLTMDLTKFELDGKASPCPEGLSFATVDQLGGNFASLYALELESSADVPNLGIRHQPDYREFCQTLLLQEENFPYWVAALQGETVVALAQHLRRSEGFFYSCGLGVLRAWRRQGVGLAVKQLALSLMKKAGGLRVDTSNDADNLPMLRLNEALGYEVLGRQAFYSRIER